MSARDPHAERELFVMSAAMIAGPLAGEHSRQFAIDAQAATDIAQAAIAIARNVARLMPCCEGCADKAPGAVDLTAYLNQLEVALRDALMLVDALPAHLQTLPTVERCAAEWRDLLAQNGARP